MYYLNTTSAARAYQEGLLAEVTRDEYTLRVVKTTKPRFQGRVFLRLGELLISWGLRLRARYEPVMVCGPDVCSSAAGKAGA